MDEPDQQLNPPRRPQFSLRAAFTVTAGCAILFASFRALGLPPLTSGFIAAILGLSLLAGASLILVIARSFHDHGGDDS